MATFKRSEFLKLTNLTRIRFDNLARRGQIPGLWDLPSEGEFGSPTPKGVVEHNLEGASARREYTARDALLMIVMDDLVRSYWGQLDLEGAVRLVSSGMSRLGSRAAQLAETDPRRELWLGAAVIRSPASEIVAMEAAAAAPAASEADKRKLRDAIFGAEPPILGTLPEMVLDVLGGQGEEPAARLLAVNVSAAYRLLKARAEHHGMELPADLNTYAY